MTAGGVLHAFATILLVAVNVVTFFASGFSGELGCSPTLGDSVGDLEVSETGLLTVRDALSIRNSWGSLVDDVPDVPTAEVSGHDVGLALSVVEEPSGSGGEFGLIPGVEVQGHVSGHGSVKRSALFRSR